MKVICFVGKRNSGKSTIIRKLIKEFFNIIKIFHPKRKTDFILCFKHKGKLIGICSAGDTLKGIKNGIKMLEDCQEIICACHPNSKGYRFLENKFSNDFKPIDCISPNEERKDDENFWNMEHKRRFYEFEKVFGKI
jgi:hypothetical protein